MVGDQLAHGALRHAQGERQFLFVGLALGQSEFNGHQGGKKSLRGHEDAEGRFPAVHNGLELLQNGGKLPFQKEVLDFPRRHAAVAPAADSDGFGRNQGFGMKVEGYFFQFSRRDGHLVANALGEGQGSFLGEFQSLAAGHGLIKGGPFVGFWLGKVHMSDMRGTQTEEAGT